MKTIMVCVASEFDVNCWSTYDLETHFRIYILACVDHAYNVMLDVGMINASKFRWLSCWTGKHEYK